MKYLYNPEQKKQHENHLRMTGCIAAGGRAGAKRRRPAPTGRKKATKK